MTVSIKKFLDLAISKNASDLIFTVGVPPVVRIDGDLVYTDVPPLTHELNRELVYSMLSEEQRREFEEERELDFSFSTDEGYRFRGNVYLQRGCIAAALRLIPNVIPTLEELKLPSVLKEFTKAHQGLLLMTGPTGHGKSTTQAAMIDIINNSRKCHIITIEDPIEYIHASKKSVVDQREIGSDTKSFSVALRHVLREDPDVILVGEMRDLETIGTALTAAETGHLVFATLHTNNSAQAIDRIIDVFPPHQQAQIRSQLSFTLLGIIAQRLIPRKDGRGRIVAVEVLKHTNAVANLIREHKQQQIPAVIESSGKLGMQTMDASLKDLFYKGVITKEEAATRMLNPQLLGTRPSSIRRP